MQAFLLVFFLVTSPAIATTLQVTERYVPNFSQTGAIQVGPEGKTLNHGCEWFHFADLSTFSDLKPVKISTVIRSSAGSIGFYFGLKWGGYVVLKLSKKPGNETNTLIQLVKYFEDGSGKNLASYQFKHNNDQWVSGLLEFEFVPFPSKILNVKFNGQDFTPEFGFANEWLSQEPDELKGSFGSFCFMGYSHNKYMSINGSKVTFK